MADASSTSVHMSEDSEVDEEDDEYSELDGVELYKGSSAAASTDNEEEMEAGSAPKLSASSASSSTSCPAEPKEVSQVVAVPKEGASAIAVPKAAVPKEDSIEVVEHDVVFAKEAVLREKYAIEPAVGAHRRREGIELAGHDMRVVKRAKTI